MAAKEATVYILDLGRSMSEKRHGRNHTDLEWALEYVWDKITTTVSRRSSGDLVRQDTQVAGVFANTIPPRDANNDTGSNREKERANERDWLSH